MRPTVRSRHTALLAAALLALGAAPALAQTVSGTLVDESTGRPVAGATVLLLGGADTAAVAGARTDAAGAWTLRAPRGERSYTLRAQKVGFATVETAPFAVGEEPVVLRLATRPEVVMLEEVSAQRLTYQAILDRRDRRMGLVMDADQIASRIARVGATDNSRLLWGLMPGMEADPALGWLQLPRRLGRPGGCHPSIVVDGEVVWRDALTELPPPDIDEVVPVWEIRALEVYHEPWFVPASLGMKDTAWDRCGVVALWTYRAVGDP